MLKAVWPTFLAKSGRERGLIMLSIAFPCFFSRSFDKKWIEFFSKVFKFSNVFKLFGYG